MKELMNYKITIPKHLLIFLGLSIGLNILRIVLFGNYSFSYMFWNIFLATLPFVVGTVLLFYNSLGKLTKPLFIIGGIMWILLLPNTFYLITDLIHIDHSHSVPILFDALMLFSCAQFGLYAGIYSLSQMEQILNSKYSQKITSRWIMIIIILTSFGMYLGRFLRFNSWDIVTDAVSLCKAILKIFTHPSLNVSAYTYTILFSVFIYLSYVAYKKINLK